MTLTTRMRASPPPGRPTTTGRAQAPRSAKARTPSAARAANRNRSLMLALLATNRARVEGAQPSHAPPAQAQAPPSSGDRGRAASTIPLSKGVSHRRDDVRPYVVMHPQNPCRPGPGDFSGLHPPLRAGAATHAASAQEERAGSVDRRRRPDRNNPRTEGTPRPRPGRHAPPSPRPPTKTANQSGTQNCSCTPLYACRATTRGDGSAANVPVHWA